MKKHQNISFILAISLLTVFFNACTGSKSAEHTGSGKTYNTPGLKLSKTDADKLYEQLLDSAIENPSKTDYEKLRMAHAASSAYNPYGDDKNMEKIRDLIKQKEFEVATEVVKTIYRNLFYDPLFHYYAFIAWTETGDEDMASIHSFYYHSLIKSILDNGDGKSPETAYYVISISEEYRIMEYLEMELLEQSLIAVDGHSFDFMKTKNKDGKKQDVYFNIDLPFKSLSNMFEE